MFKQISIKEETLLIDTTRICLVNSKHVESKPCNIYFYPVVSFDDGLVVFECSHRLTSDSFVLDSIQLCEKSVELHDLDEQVVYSLIPILIKFSINFATLLKKNKVVLKSNLQHFAEHLVDNGFEICRRVVKGQTNSPEKLMVKGTKTINS